MKACAVLALLLSLAAGMIATATAQAGLPLPESGWSWQRPVPQGNDLLGVDFVDWQHGWAVGLHDTVLKSSDGGATWSARSSGMRRDLLAVDFASTSVGYAVGGGGVIIRSDDGGETWVPQASRVTSVLWDVAAVDARSAWAVGLKGRIVHTADGGKHWRLQPSGTSDNLFSVTFVDSTHGWVTATDAVLATRDGGVTWKRRATPVNESPHAVVFADREVGWYVTQSGHILHTNDGGFTWTRQFSAPETMFTAISCSGALTACAVGVGTQETMLPSALTIYLTNDGGATWEKQPFVNLSAPPSLTAVSVSDPNHIVAVGRNGAVARTADGGDSWASSDPAAWRDLSDVRFDGEVGWAVGAMGEYASAKPFTIMRTTDAGTTWADVGPAPAGQYRTVMGLHSVAAVGAESAWAVGYSPGVLHTGNGGQTWEMQRDLAPSDPANRNQQLAAIDFLDLEHGMAGGQSSEGLPLVIVTSNGGVTWSDVSPATGGPVSDVVLGSDGAAWIAAGGSIQHTVNGGAAWSRATAPSGLYVLDVVMVDRLRGWATANTPFASFILMTTDGGANWSISYRGTHDANSGIGAIDATDADHCWAIFMDRVVCTTDGGETWRKERAGTQNAGGAIDFVNNRSGYIAGTGGLIIHTANGGVAPADATVPVPYVLENASVTRNRSVTLKYEVCDPDATTTVRITIRSRTGRIVKRLGPRSVSANAPHGFSFRCTLIAGSYSFSVTASDSQGHKSTLPARGTLKVR